MSESSLILPGQEQSDVDSMIARLPEVVWLRNPKTGVIFKFLKPTHADSIRHALKGETGEGGRQPYSLSTEEAARAQAIELAKLQGRPLPPWAANIAIVTPDPEPEAATVAPAAEKSPTSKAK